MEHLGDYWGFSQLKIMLNFKAWDSLHIRPVEPAMKFSIENNGDNSPLIIIIIINEGWATFYIPFGVSAY